jgi:hypothetical protein
LCGAPKAHDFVAKRLVRVPCPFCHPASRSDFGVCPAPIQNAMFELVAPQAHARGRHHKHRRLELRRQEVIMQLADFSGKKAAHQQP